jgi:hypothetical protein
VDLVINGGRNTGKNLPIRSGDGYIITTGKGSEAMVRFELETPSVSRAGFEVKDYLNLPLFQYDPPALPDFKIMVDNYYEEWFRLLDARRKGRGEADKVFLGNKFCAKCHQKQYQLWISSAHSKAYEVLLKPVENRCLVCHTTGFEYPTGFYDLELSPGLAGIGCEECHYFKKIPGKEDEHIVPEMNEKSCRCHIAPYDPDFNFKCSTLKVKH